MEYPSLFHVAAQALPTRQVLRPYAVASEYPHLVGLAEREIGAGHTAIQSLLAGEE